MAKIQTEKSNDSCVPKRAIYSNHKESHRPIKYLYQDQF